MQDFLDTWHEAARTTLGFFWMAAWAFGLGYLLSGMIQVFVTRERMRRNMGEAGPRSVLLGTVFGFVSSSCSFAALSTTRALFAKGAGLIPALAFLLASTNLVIELGIVIAIFLGWQFVVGEYVGGVLLIGITWIVVRALYPRKLVESARERARADEGDGGDGEVADWRERIKTREGWLEVARRYRMEWGMVWKDVTIGFTVAGAIAAFVPRAFFEALFVGSGSDDPAFHEVLLQTLVGPLAAFFTFIGSMGNIPLAAVLHGNGVSFAGVMAFIFSDLVVFPVLRIQSRYYGWRFAFYVLGVFLLALVATALALHYGFAAFGALPGEGATTMTDRAFFAVDHTLFLNLAFVAQAALAFAWVMRADGLRPSLPQATGERILLGIASLAILWLAGGLAAPLFA